MAHLTRIYLKTTQAQKLGSILPSQINRRYLAHKKNVGLRLKMDASSFDVSSNEKNTTFSLANEKDTSGGESKNKFGRREEFYPQIDPFLCKNLKSVTGISLTSYSVGWCKLDLTRKSLLEFGCMALSLREYNKEFYALNTIHKIARAVMGALPASDLYVLENYKRVLDKNKNMNLLEIQLLSMLTVLLNSTEYDMNREKAFFQNASVIDFLYELRIKEERISTGQKLQRILNESISMHINDDAPDMVVADLSCIKLNVKFDFLNLVFSAQPLRRDALATSFFLALSFVELNKNNLDL